MAKFHSIKCFKRPSATDVDGLYEHFYRQLYNNAANLIVIDGIPENGDTEYIKQQLLLSGKVHIFKKANNIYLLDGHEGGQRDIYHRPMEGITNNPILGSIRTRLSGENQNGVMVYLTPFDRTLWSNPLRSGGIDSLISYVATLLADNISSINVAQINSRVTAIATSEDSSEAISAENVLKEIYNGKPYKVITSKLLKRFEVNPIATSVKSSVIGDLIECHQYIYSMFWNALGIDSPFNMKRERLNTSEVEQNIDKLAVPLETILETLNEGFSKANEIFGTNLSANKNPKIFVENDENSDVANSPESEVDKDEIQDETPAE